ncbi:MAG: hypothetical protein IKL58_02880, partial [Phascolarctobacterium sp.]|nr:hypothetical protein [Phascolarctobacterium sp.]
MAKKTNKYAGYQAVEDVMGVGAYVGLGRPVDLNDNNTRMAIVGSIISMAAVTAWQIMKNVEVWDAAFTGVGAALGFLFSYMIAQELDPDRKFGGIIGGVLTMAATAYLGEGNIMVVLWLMFVLRMLNRTSGSRHKIGDNVIIIGISAWLGHD